MKLHDTFKIFTVQGSPIKIRRGQDGVVYLRGKDDLDFSRALGFAHACDRMLQMVLVRIVAQGRLSELIRDTEETFASDVFMRQMGFSADAKVDRAHLTADGQASGVRGSVLRGC